MSEVFDKATEKAGEVLSESKLRGLASLRETAPEAAQKRWEFEKFPPVHRGLSGELKSGRGMFWPIGYKQTPTAEEYPTHDIEREWAVPELLKDFLVLLEGAGGKPIAPEDVFKGLIGPTGSAIGAGIAKAGIKGATDPTVMRMFAGPSAKTADLVALKKAKDMDKTRQNTRKEIWEETGWIKDKEGNWTFEISDREARITGKRHGRAEDILTHPELYKAYPELQEIPQIRYQGSGRSQGYFKPLDLGDVRKYIGRIANKLDPEFNPEEFKSVQLHELQHGVQHLEGLPMGGSPAMFSKTDLSRAGLSKKGLKDRVKVIEALAKKGYTVDDLFKRTSYTYYPTSSKYDLAPWMSLPFYKKFKKPTEINVMEMNDGTLLYPHDLHISPTIINKFYNKRRNQEENSKRFFGLDLNKDIYKLLNIMERFSENPHEIYMRLAGEAQARNVQRRMQMTPSERKATSPWETLDRPESDLLYIYPEWWKRSGLSGLGEK